MSRARLVSLALMATVAAAAAGCQPPPPPPPKPLPPPPPPPTAVRQRSMDADRFRDVLARYDADVGDLPGHTQGDHRAAAAMALTELSQLLPLAYGSAMTPSPGFASDVAIVTAAARTVSATDVPRDRMAAVENQAGQAAVSALRVVAMRVLYNDAELPPLLDAAADKAAVARGTLGPLHDTAATDVFLSLQTALHKVDADLQEQFAGVQELPETPAMPPPMSVPPVAPAAMPAETPAAPTTAPATPMAPATTMPTTMP